MRSTFPNLGLPLLHRGVFAAAAVTLVLLFGGADGVPGSPAAALGAGSHSDHCACGKKCRGKACCCRPDAAVKLTTALKPKVSRGPDSRLPSVVENAIANLIPGKSNPCMGEAPCDAPFLPSSRHSGPWSKVFLLVAVGFATIPASRRHVSTTTLEAVPTRRLARVEEPPELLHSSA